MREDVDLKEYPVNPYGFERAFGYPVNLFDLNGVSDWVEQRL